MPRVSIIVPVYNTEAFLKECLDSILNQTFTDLELIAVDDGSTDASLDMLREYEAADSRVTVLTQPNKYAGTARNLGMSHATGEFFLFLDSDDIFDANMVEHMVKRADEDNSEIVICRSRSYNMSTGRTDPIRYALRYVPWEKSFAGADYADDLFMFAVGWPWDKMFRASFVAQHHLEFMGTRSTNDAYFVFMAEALATRISALNEELATHRTENKASISNTREKSYDNFITAIEAIKERLVEEGLYETYERAFINWMVHFSVWNNNTIAPVTRPKLYAAINSRVAPLVGDKVNDIEYFSAKNEIETFRKILGLDPWLPKEARRRPLLNRAKEIIKRRIDKAHRGLFSPSERPPYESTVEFEAIKKASDFDPLAPSGEDRPKVSVVVPIYNVEMYLVQALDSLVNQTLTDIEIICINDGSKDSSLDIINQYAARDSRIVVVDKKNEGYGIGMNTGIDKATGKYLTILEPDDYMPLDALETLYFSAQHFDVQIAKADFMRFVEKHAGEACDFFPSAGRGSYYHRIIKPIDEPDVFYFNMNTWCAIYDLDWLREHNIRHNTTPGASFQDNGFWFTGFCEADRVVFVHKNVYFNRRDNPNSSVKDKGKAMAADNEYMHIYYSYLAKHPEIMEKVIGHFWVKYFHNARFTYGRVDASLKRQVMEVTADRLNLARDRGEIDFSATTPYEATSMMVLMDDVDNYIADYIVVDYPTAAKRRRLMNWHKLKRMGQLRQY